MADLTRRLCPSDSDFLNVTLNKNTEEPHCWRQHPCSCSCLLLDELRRPGWLGLTAHSDQRHKAYKRRLSESVCSSYFWQQGRGLAGCEEGGLAETVRALRCLHKLAPIKTALSLLNGVQRSQSVG